MLFLFTLDLEVSWVIAFLVFMFFLVEESVGIEAKFLRLDYIGTSHAWIAVCILKDWYFGRGG